MMILLSSKRGRWAIASAAVMVFGMSTFAFGIVGNKGSVAPPVNDQMNGSGTIGLDTGIFDCPAELSENVDAPAFGRLDDPSSGLLAIKCCMGPGGGCGIFGKCPAGSTTVACPCSAY